ncbi:MAG: hypothetical protein BMS9Abin20_0128 [Acidimicrobiia bacterium]|nr:MAG: hypothetical protein BMS9Abin20_0128 [Acidimicrobiia bacterium]
MGEAIIDTLSDIWRGKGFEITATIGTIIAAVVVMAIVRRSLTRWRARVASRLTTSEAQEDRERGQRLSTLTDVARLIIAVVVWSVVVLTIMGLWGIPMAPLFAVGTTVGIAVGFGAQDAVRDVIAGFLILLEDQYSIGDVVSIAGVDGSVEAIKLRTTVLRDLEGNLHHVPNGQIQVASNRTPDFSRYVADIPVAYGTDLDHAMAIILDEARAMAEDPEWRRKFLTEPEMLGINELGDSSVIIRVLMTLAAEERWSVKREFLRRLKRRLDDEGIEIPFAYLNVIVQHEDR